jgi:predicted ATPase/DNA-binding SARP family transcriptional activator
MDNAPVAAAQMRVLGTVEVVAEEGARALSTQHARLLVTLVLARGRACGRDELVEALWSGPPPASAQKLVQVYVSQLRKLLPCEIEIVTRGGGYAIELPDEALDATRFERLVRESAEARRDGNPALALSLTEQALALWRGRAYGQLAYEEFARAESERLEELRLVAREQRVDALLALGRHGDVLGDALALASEHHLRERAHELAMLALYRCGRQAEALEHYAGLRERLADELGLEPGPALRDLQRRILQQDSSLEPQRGEGRASVTLPLPPNPLVGRERELEELLELLEGRRSRLVVLTGAGGSGKTRLALEVARRAEGRYANGAALVELAPLRESALVVPTIAHALDVPLDTGQAALTGLVDALGSRELLLVIDNAEHVRDAAPAYAELVARAPRLTLLVTSRAVLHVSGEHVFPVAPLSDDAAVQLFVQRASLLGASVTGDSEDVREICRRVDCLPLAIELAAARARVLTPRVLRQRLDACLRVLTGGPRDLPARQQTLRETIGWSVDLLPARARDVFARLAVFPGGASLTAAEEVADADIDTLSALVDDHLLRREDVDAEPRFGMLETIREYALELLAEDEPAAGVRMAEHLADLVEAIELEARVDANALSRLDAEIDNIRAALDVASAAGDPELELRLAGGIWRFCWVRGLAAEGLRRIERALRSQDGTATPARARALQGGAGLAWSLGDLERAKRLARAAIPVAADVGSTWDEMAANTVLGVVANNEGDRAAARHHHRRSMQLGEGMGLEPFAQKLNLGIVELDSGEYEEARALFEDVLGYHRRTGNDQGVGFALINLGVVHHALGDPASSLAAFREGRERFERVGFRAHVAHAVQGFAAFEAGEGRFAEAARLLGRARAELDEVGAAEHDFAADMVEWTKRQVAEALGADGFEAEYAAGRDGR